MASNCAGGSAAGGGGAALGSALSASKTKTKKKHFVCQKVKLFRASEPLLSVLMWGANHTVSSARTPPPPPLSRRGRTAFIPAPCLPWGLGGESSSRSPSSRASSAPSPAAPFLLPPSHRSLSPGRCPPASLSSVSPMPFGITALPVGCCGPGVLS